MSTWFFATTPAPRPAYNARRRRRRVATTPWWERAGERIVAWGENAQHHRMGSFTRR